MFVQMIDILRNSIIEGGAHRNVIEERKMLNIFTQAGPARVRANRDAELCRHEHHREHFVNARQPAAIDLAEADCLCLQELFEDHPILTGFTRGDADRRDGPGDFGRLRRWRHRSARAPARFSRDQARRQARSVLQSNMD